MMKAFAALFGLSAAQEPIGQYQRKTQAPLVWLNMIDHTKDASSLSNLWYAKPLQVSKLTDKQFIDLSSAVDSITTGDSVVDIYEEQR